MSWPCLAQPCRDVFPSMRQPALSSVAVCESSLPVAQQCCSHSVSMFLSLCASRGALLFVCLPCLWASLFACVSGLRPCLATGWGPCSQVFVACAPSLLNQKVSWFARFFWLVPCGRMTCRLCQRCRRLGRRCLCVVLACGPALLFAGVAVRIFFWHAPRSCCMLGVPVCRFSSLRPSTHGGWGVVVCY